MRFGLASWLVVYCYERIPGLDNEAFDETVIRRYIGETSIKLGMIVLFIAFVGVFRPDSFHLATIIGWVAFIIAGYFLVVLKDRYNVFKKRRKRKGKSY